MEVSVDTNGEQFCFVQKSKFNMFYCLTFLGMSNNEGPHADFCKNNSTFMKIQLMFNGTNKTAPDLISLFGDFLTSISHHTD